jgi:hypothetical protein
MKMFTTLKVLPTMPFVAPNPAPVFENSAISATQTPFAHAIQNLGSTPIGITKLADGTETKVCALIT